MTNLQSISIKTAAETAARKLSVRLAGIGAIIVFAVFIAAMTYGLKSRNTAVVQAMTPYLVQLLKTNDVFDATRQLNSLIVSETFSSFELYDLDHKTLVSSGAADTNRTLQGHRATNEQSWWLGFSGGRPELNSAFFINEGENDLHHRLNHRLIISSPLPLLPIFAVLTLLTVFWAGFYYLVRRRMIDFASEISAPIVSFAAALKKHNLENPLAFEVLDDSTQYTEIAEMHVQFESLFSRLEASEEKRREAERDAALANQARVTAHNLKSPVLALEIAVETLAGVHEKTRIIVRSAVNSIRSIVDRLMLQHQELGLTEVKPATALTELAAFSSSSMRVGTHLVSSLIEGVVSERRMQYRSRPNVTIDCRLGANTYGLFASLDPVEFRNALSNLVNNAFEAIDASGEISISLQTVTGNFVEIMVSDNGKGIPAEIIPRLMQKGETFSKPGGQGIGLYHARKAVESWGGTIRIESELGKGTRVYIFLPRAEAPKWFLPELQVKSDTRVVVVDDDPSIHEIWKDRLQGTPMQHFNGPNDWTSWQRDQRTGNEETLYLVDHEFVGHSQTGLELIEELGVQGRAVLVTSHFDDRDVVEGCRRLGVPLLPKTLAGMLKITVA